MILYQGAIGRFINAVSELAVTVGRFRYNNRYLLQLYDFLDLPNEMYQGTLAVEKRDDIDYEIEFKDVSFKYPRTDVWALRHVNMKFKIGDKLAIVGENGSGKTTFIKLLCRLDEPTAALDPIAEAAVYENFNKIVQNKTSVFISHRLSSCRFCDTIAVFDHGRLIQQGSHDALVADGEGKYCHLWEAQAKYYNAQSN